MRRIVVLRAGALGDVILSFPALAEIRRRYPGARISVVGYPQLWETAGTLVDEVASIDHPRFAGLFGGRATVGRTEFGDPQGTELLEWLKGTDLVIAWTARDPSNALRGAGVREVVHASPYPPPGVHAAEWLVESLGPADFPPPPNGCRFPIHRAGAVLPNRFGVPVASPLPLTGGGEIGCQRSRENFSPSPLVYGPEKDLEGEGKAPIFIHPGAGAVWKRWPAERFAALADRLRRRNSPVVLIEGPADEEAVREVQKNIAGQLPVLRGLSLPRLAVELRTGRLFIGNDSGVTHLAAWLGLPTIALFGPTDPASWVPLGNVRVLRTCTSKATRRGEIRVCADPGCMSEPALRDVLLAVENYVDNQ